MKLTVNQKSIWLIILGLLYPITLRVWGIIRVGEILAILLGIWTMAKYGHSYMKIKSFRKLIFLYCLCLVAILISDWVNQVDAVDALKGFGSFAFLLPFFYVGMWLLSDDLSRIKYFVIACTVAQWLVFLFLPQFSYEASVFSNVEYATIKDKLDLNEELFAYQYAPIILVFLCLFYSKHKKLLSVLLLPISLFFLFGGSRNLFLVYACAGVLLLMLFDINSSNKVEKILRFRKRIIVVVLGMALFAGIVNFSYMYLAKNGFLGDVAQWKYEYQSQDGNIFIGGRPHFFIGAYAALKEPIWGYGSYAKDVDGIASEFARKYDLKLDFETFSHNLIPTHSHIIYFWVCNGIMTLPFWIFVIYNLVIFILRGNWAWCLSQSAYYLIVSLSLLWAVFFSPYQDRLTFAFIIVAVVLMNTTGRLIEHNRK